MPKIFLIDADAERSGELAEDLEKENFQVVTCRTSHGVLGQLRRELPDAVLIEVILPGNSGFEIAARMQADRRLRTIPVFFTTDIQDSDETHQDYFSRPLRLEELVEAIRNRIGA
jgi:putative two-component system response regulator